MVVGVDGGLVDVLWTKEALERKNEFKEELDSDRCSSFFFTWNGGPSHV